jgi:hypothetical protein
MSCPYGSLLIVMQERSKEAKLCCFIGTAPARVAVPKAVGTDSGSLFADRSSPRRGTEKHHLLPTLPYCCEDRRRLRPSCVAIWFPAIMLFLGVAAGG